MILKIPNIVDHARIYTTDLAFQRIVKFVVKKLPSNHETILKKFYCLYLYFEIKE